MKARCKNCLKFFSNRSFVNSDHSCMRSLTEVLKQVKDKVDDLISRESTLQAKVQTLETKVDQLTKSSKGSRA